MRVRLDNTSCDTSLMIFAFSLGDSVVNHFASRCERVCAVSASELLHWWATRLPELTTLPCLESKIR